MMIMSSRLIGGQTYHEGLRQCEEATTSWGSELSKCAQPSNTMEMEVEVSLVGDGNCSWVVLKRGSTQGQMEEKVQGTYARLRKKGQKRR